MGRVLEIRIRGGKNMKLIAEEELPNIKLNALLWQIEYGTKVRVVKYENDSIVEEGDAQTVYKALRYCNFDVVGVEKHNRAIEITIKTEIS